MTDAANETPADSEAPLLNEFERRLSAQLEAIGVVNPGVPEHGFRAAQVYGDWKGRVAFVHGYEQAESAWSGEIVESIEISGVSAVVVEPSLGPLPGEPMIHFTCRDEAYEVASLSGDFDTDLGTSDVSSSTELARLLISELGC